MKNAFILIILLLFAASVYSNDYSKSELDQKLNKFKKMRTTGIVLTVVGIPMAAFGIPMYFSESGKQDPNDLNFGKFIGGAVLMVAGEIMVVGGIVMWAFGNSRVNRYKNLLDQKDSGLSFGLTRKGFGIQYRF